MSAKPVCDIGARDSTGAIPLRNTAQINASQKRAECAIHINQYCNIAEFVISPRTLHTVLQPVSDTVSE